MNYVCKNCGKLVTQKEYEEEISKDKSGIGCLFWILFILFFVSIILIPIAIILLFMHYNKNSNISECPFCHAKDSLIPENTPMAQNIIKENYQFENKELYIDKSNTDIKNSNNNDVIEQDKKHSSVYFWILLIIISIGLYSSVQDEKYKTPRDINAINCKNYKHLCIAEYNVKYTAIRDNTGYYNGWLGAANACKNWGGRLPYKDELPILKEAFEKNVIRRSAEDSYFLSNTPYSFEQVFVLNLSGYSNDITTVSKYLKPYITEFGLIEPSPDKYGYSARCVITTR